MKSKKLQGALQKFNQMAPKSDVELISESEELKIIGGVTELEISKDCDSWSGSCGSWSGSCGTY